MKQESNPTFPSDRDVYCFAEDVSRCRALLDGGARIIQFRNKEMADDAYRRTARAMVDLARRRGNAILIVNDRVDIALSVGAHGVHVGREDEAYREVLRRVPEGMIVGVSARTPAAALAAQEAGAGYVGTGSVFPTATKSDAEVIGPAGLRAVVRAVRIPVVAIGGITLANVATVAETGCRHFAVISGINEATDIPGRIREFRDRIRDTTITQGKGSSNGTQ